MAYIENLLSKGATEQKKSKVHLLITKKKNKDLKEKLEQGRISMKDMKRRRGPYIQVKTGGTVKRKSGGLIGMGAALRGGGAVRKRGS